MNARNAFEALSTTLEDIARILSDSGLITRVRCRFSGVDFDEFDDLTPQAAVLFGEIYFSTVLGEGGAIDMAVGIDEGEVTNDELLREITDIRAEARRIAEIKRSTPDDDAFIKALGEDEEEEETEDDIEFDDAPREKKKITLTDIFMYIGIGLIAVGAFIFIFSSL